MRSVGSLPITDDVTSTARRTCDRTAHRKMRSGAIEATVGQVAPSGWLHLLAKAELPHELYENPIA